MALEKWSTMVLMAVFPERDPILSQIPWQYEIWLAIGKYETCKTLFQKLFQVEGLGNLATAGISLVGLPSIVLPLHHQHF